MTKPKKKIVIVRIGTLTILRREPSSRNGNPRYFAIISEGSEKNPTTFYTAPDSSLAYSLPNYNGDKVMATLRMYRGRLTLDSITPIK